MAGRQTQDEISMEGSIKRLSIASFILGVIVVWIIVGVFL